MFFFYYYANNTNNFGKAASLIFNRALLGSFGLLSVCFAFSLGCDTLRKENEEWERERERAEPSLAIVASSPVWKDKARESPPVRAVHYALCSDEHYEEAGKKRKLHLAREGCQYPPPLRGPASEELLAGPSI